MKYYMGIDNGGTTTKAALYREDGFCAGVASTETAMLVPRAGFTERVAGQLHRYPRCNRTDRHRCRRHRRRRLLRAWKGPLPLG